MEGFVDVSALMRPGVYLLWRSGKVVYVGQSKCPLVRIYTHRSFARKRAPKWIRSRGIIFDQVQIKPTRIEDLDAVEKKLIVALAPIHNIQHSTSAPIDLRCMMQLPPLPPPEPFERRI